MPQTVNQKLSELLNLAAPPEDEETSLVPTKPMQVVSSGDPDKDMQDDWEIVRSGTRNLIDKSNELVDNANFFAKEKQDARSVEAASMAIKEARETLQSLINLHKTRKEIERVSTSSPAKSGDITATQNNVFVGTTGELLKLTKELNAGGGLAAALKTIDIEPSQSSLNTVEKEKE
jgi:hypothetical protein